MPLDPKAQELLDDVKASGRPNAHLLPVAEARENFEALFESLGPAKRSPRPGTWPCGQRPRGTRALVPARRGRPPPRSRRTTTAAAGCSGRWTPTTSCAGRSPTPPGARRARRVPPGAGAPFPSGGRGRYAAAAWVARARRHARGRPVPARRGRRQRRRQPRGGRRLLARERGVPASASSCSSTR